MVFTEPYGSNVKLLLLRYVLVVHFLKRCGGGHDGG